MTKDELEAAIRVANTWSGRSTLVLAIGILGEYVLLPFLEKKRWQKGAKIFCAVLVVAGIFGEYEFSSQISQNAGDLQRLSDTEVADARAVASKADDHAKSADASGKQLGIDLEVEKQKTSRFQKDADVARLALESQVGQASARYLLLNKGKDQFLKATVPFMGQKVELLSCRGLEKDNEAGLLLSSINGLLRFDAKWDVRQAVWETCGFGFGLSGVNVSVNEGSSASTMAAAEAVSIVLEKLFWGDFNKKEFNGLLKERTSPSFSFPQRLWSWVMPVISKIEPPLSAETVRILVLGHQPR